MLFAPQSAMERFGLSVSGETAGMGGIPLDVLQGLFDRYDSDGPPRSNRYDSDVEPPL